MAKYELKVFFDIETFTVNRSQKPALQKAYEYSVSYKYDYNKKPVEKVVNSLHDMIEDLLTLKKRKIVLLAHNGEGYDFHFLEKSIKENYALIPHAMYLRNSVNHTYETMKKDLHGDYLLESRVRAKSRLNIEFKIGKTVFTTSDTYPKFHASIKTLGQMLKEKGIGVEGQNEKLDYKDDYTKYDKKENMTDSEARKYSKQIFNQLSSHAIKYVMNDTRVMYLAYKHYNELYAKSYDPERRTLSLNILDQYKINSLANFQLINEIPGESERLELTKYVFMKERNKYITVYDYIHRFYKGGLNIYNEDYLGKTVHNLVHMDLNSSYPTVMHQKQFPTFIVDGGLVKTNLKLEDNYYYFLQVSKITFQNLIVSKIKSKVLREMLVKYLASSDESVYIQTPHLELIEDILKTKIKEIPVISFIKFETQSFGGRKVIEENYKMKTKLKKEGAPSAEIQAYKVPLNGIYGIPALRAYYPLFEIDPSDPNNFINIKDKLGNLGFKNQERNLTYACSVTAWAFKQLLEPLTYDVSGVDKNFMYADTDSLFLRKEYFKKIKPNIFLDHVKLGAWDLEHTQVDNFYCLNHKKYALQSNNKIEIHAGGVPLSSFQADKYKNFEKFIKEKFHKGKKIKALRSMYSKDKSIILYEGYIDLDQGSEYIDHFPRNKQELETDILNQLIIKSMIYDTEEKEQSDPALYYETALGSYSPSDAYPPRYSSDFSSRHSFKDLISAHAYIKSKMKHIKKK